MNTLYVVAQMIVLYVLTLCSFP